MVRVPTEAFLRFLRVTGGVDVAARATDYLDTNTREPILRGLFCIAASGLEAYFTKLAVDVSVDRLVTDDLKELRHSLQLFGDCFWPGARGEKRSRTLRLLSAGSPARPAELLECVHADMTALTFNRPSQIDRLLRWCVARGWDADAFWDAVAKEGDFGHANDVRESLDLGIERRNAIAHTGDYSFGGRACSLSPEMVIRFSKITRSIVTVSEDFFVFE